MEKTLTEMAVELVCAQLTSSSLRQDEVTQALHKHFSTLRSLKEAESTGSVEAPQSTAMIENPMNSIQKRKIICLECGEEFRSLSSKHLQSHGLTGKEYRKKWGFSMRQPLCAKDLTAQRKAASKKRGLPENLRKSMVAKKAKAEKSLPKTATGTSVAKKTARPKAQPAAAKISEG